MYRDLHVVLPKWLHKQLFSHTTQSHYLHSTCMYMYLFLNSVTLYVHGGGGGVGVRVNIHSPTHIHTQPPPTNLYIHIIFIHMYDTVLCDSVFLIYTCTCTYINHIADVALGTGKLCCFLGLYVNDEIEIVPQTMLPLYVIFKRHLLILKFTSLQTFSTAGNSGCRGLRCTL